MAIAGDHRGKSMVFFCFRAYLQALLGKHPWVLVTDPWGRETDCCKCKHVTLFYPAIFQFSVSNDLP